MGHLVKAVLSFALLCSVECLQKRGIVETNYGYHQYHQPQKFLSPNFYTKEQSSVVHDASKQSPVVVSLDPSAVSNYQQFQTVGQPAYNVQASVQVPHTAQQNAYLQGVLPYSQANQYSVHQPFQTAGQNLYIPFNQFQQISANLNNDYRKPQSTNSAPQFQQLGQKVGAVKSPPLFHHQVYHPLHTSVQPGNHAQQIHHGNNAQQQRLSLPTPPRIHTNFRPIIPTKPAQIQQSPVITSAPIKTPQYKPVVEQQVEEKEEINDEEQEEDNEKLQDDEEDHGNVQTEDEEDEEQFKQAKYFSGRFMTDDDQEDHGRYRHQEADEDDEDQESHRYSESRPLLSSKYKYPKDSYYKNKHLSKPFKADPDYRNFRDFEEPKVEYKMYKYSKSTNKPQGNENIEGKGSENVPVIQHNQKSYKEQWMISSKTSSMSSEEL